MSSLLDKFYNAIPANLYTGFTVKLDYMPDSPVECIALLLDIQSSVKYFGQEASIDSAIVTMQLRSADFDIGYDVCEVIRNYLDMVSNSDFLGITAIGPTAILGKDSKGNREFMVQFKIMVKE